ncbi:hypothetical protein [Thalassotalea sp. G2M2-11]|uniref:hypothetical protein n=1 Tax=Thalassotalea sp. G2M2-11 TaxID=2787627 RepID=UPI0019D297FD|nr:hypothetical protein [Thalassotalea sp. G2M2-11]
MKKFCYALIVSLTSILAISGCSKVVNIELAPEVKVFLSDDRDKTIYLTSADQAYQTLNAWLKSHQDGWYPTSGTYSGGIYVRSGDKGIQVTERRVIIYSTEKAKPQAIFVQEINNSDLLVVKNIGKQ